VQVTGPHPLGFKVAKDSLHLLSGESKFGANIFGAKTVIYARYVVQNW
jgi:hypothetical protein